MSPIFLLIENSKQGVFMGILPSKSLPPSPSSNDLRAPLIAPSEDIQRRVSQVSEPIFSRDCIKCAGGAAICAGSLLGAGLSWGLAPQSLGCALATISGCIAGCGAGARVCSDIGCFPSGNGEAML